MTDAKQAQAGRELFAWVSEKMAQLDRAADPDETSPEKSQLLMAEITGEWCRGGIGASFRDELENL